MQPRIAIAAALAVLVVAAPGARAQQQQLELKIAARMPVGATATKYLQQLAADVDAGTQHRVRLKLYVGGALGDEKDYVKEMSRGRLDGAELTSAGLAQIAPRIGVLTLPRLFASAPEADAVTRSAWPTYVAIFQKRGYFLSDPDEESWETFYSGGRIDSLDGLQHAAVWEDIDDPAIRDLYAELGVVGTSIAATDVATALANGQLGACYASPMELVAWQWSTHVGFQTSMHLRRRLGALVITWKALAGLSAADRAVVLAGLRAAAAGIARHLREDDASATTSMQRAGLAIVATPQDMEASVDAAAAKTWQDLVGTAYDQQDLDAVIQLRDNYRANHQAAAAPPP